MTPQKTTTTTNKQTKKQIKKQSRSVPVYLQPHQTIAVFHQTCYIYRASTTYAQSTRLFNTYVIIFDTADTYVLVIYPKYRINSFESLSEAGIIKHNATERASAFTHTDTHIEGRGKIYYNVCWKRVTNRARNEFFDTFDNAAKNMPV